MISTEGLGKGIGQSPSFFVDEIMTPQKKSSKDEGEQQYQMTQTLKR
jgi:hypothetical protein